MMTGGVVVVARVGLWRAKSRASRMDGVQKLDISFDRLKNPFNAQILVQRNS